MRIVRIALLFCVCISLQAFGAELPLAPAVECHPRSGLPNVLAKLQAGQDVRIAYLGGSITAQAGWRPKDGWLVCRAVPQATVSEINAAIGRWDRLGPRRVRLEHDVLVHRPTCCVVGSRQTTAAAPRADIRCMEGIVGDLRNDPATDSVSFTPRPATCCKRSRARSSARPVRWRRSPRLRHPSIHMGWSRETGKEGKLIFQGRNCD
jgi:hypothetical protein